MGERKTTEQLYFGYTPVTGDEKNSRVRGVFDSVAENYDLMNDVMSAGMHRCWKDRLIRKIGPRPGKSYLDVAGGTGDIAFRLHRATNGQAPITVCDINDSMLAVGRDRAIDRGIVDIDWITGSAEALPLPDSSQDVYTIAFGLRNVTRIDDALSEAFRVLKPGGRFYCLEFSRVDPPAFRKLYDLYSFNAIPQLGRLIANDEESYRYLVESIRQFPDQNKLARRIAQAGFAHVRYNNLQFGLVAIHTGLKT
jgi:demethylmenaquinone methyltransferase/2-methoxy-6-polyprenyl-1,4-benzoquinol methylase